jgi:hypothetical protein
MPSEILGPALRRGGARGPGLAGHGTSSAWLADAESSALAMGAGQKTAAGGVRLAVLAAAVPARARGAASGRALLSVAAESNAFDGRNAGPRPRGAPAGNRPRSIDGEQAVIACRTMELRALTVLDSLQPQLTGFLQTVCAGFMPLEEEAALFLEIAPGIAINQLTDVALKATTCRPGMQIVERAYGMLELHNSDKGQVEAAVDAILSRMGVLREERIKPRIVSSQIITGIDGKQSQLINRMRHGDMILSGQTLYILEVFPAAYAALAANEAEKAANIQLLEVITFGAFGRLWLGGSEAEIKAAVEAAEGALANVAGRDVKR